MEAITILDFHSAERKTYREYAGACPVCGGRDRCLIWPDRPNGGAFLCRNCEAKGNGKDFLMHLGMTEREAKAALKLPANGKTNFKRRPQPPKKVALSLPPSAQWMERAAALVAECQKNLQHPEAVATLKDRGLTIATAQKLGIGWNERDRYELCTEWELAEVEGRNKIRIPKGLVIPTRRKIGIIAVTIRQPQAQPRYWQVRGSQNAPYVVGQASVPLFLFEGALDAVLLWQEMQGQCAAIALGGSTKTADDATAAFINTAPLVVAVPDDDEAGHKAWSEWRRFFPSAVCVYTLKVNDLTDMHRASKYDHTVPSVKQWADVALNIATQTRSIPNPTQGIRQDVPELKTNTTQGTESEKIDFNSMRLAEICANPELVQAYREKHPFATHEVRENISCPKLGYGYRSKRDCLACTGDPLCIMPLLNNPYSDTQPLEVVKSTTSPCPLGFLNDRGVTVMDIDPAKGISLATDYECPQDLRTSIEFWTLGQFEELLAVFGEVRSIPKKVNCTSLNYK